MPSKKKVDVSEWRVVKAFARKGEEKASDQEKRAESVSGANGTAIIVSLNLQEDCFC
jgi:hypothetical protein